MGEAMEENGGAAAGAPHPGRKNSVVRAAPMQPPLQLLAG